MAAAKNLIQFMKAFELLSRPGGISIKELQEKLDISRRSVYRLFESMDELGYPLVDSPLDGKTKSWGLMAEYVSARPSGRVPRLSLNTAEIMILYQILSRQTPLYESGMKQTISALRNRLEQFYLENSGAEELQRFKDIFINIPGQYKHLEGKEKIYETLLQAALEKKYCRGSYRSFRDGGEEEKEIEFAPLCFFEWNYGLYCFVYRREDQALRTMALERFESIRMSDRPFREEPEFDPESMLSNAWALTCNDPVSVVIHFSKEAAPYIREREWQPGQKIELNTDGSLVLKLKTSGRRDVKSWILSFGKDAELLKPADLRNEINKELTELYKKYNK
ncbi:MULTISPECIES: YafY family protein [unclassified Oceanispirochaeta]|uniref:helix-turn-helix transcriptional regulator n=1 Tax=unclassified Oceanispirochaeta TaxID=2635722 RepID=UPI000E09C1CF|nr:MULTISPECIES: transcriptional regulator [unclassified Oceanispirochaeta]MBF9014523.1 transcriptional regulator [Oceanispirochaeta sp. M2]NPD70779.1 transcriptional regulator [Oceanispirochaeta sp. M1]RDG34060.1 transcriptional regulator [Oceanispirochaeta sp. M1]